MKISLLLMTTLTLLPGISNASTEDGIAAAEKTIATLKAEVAPLADNYLVKDVDIKADMALDPIVELVKQIASQSITSRTFTYHSTRRTGYLWRDGDEWCGSYAQIKNDDSLTGTAVIDAISAQIADDGGILISADITISVSALLDFHFYGPRERVGWGPFSANACSLKDAHGDWGWRQGARIPNDHERVVVRVSLKMGASSDVDYQVQIVDPTELNVMLRLGFDHIGEVSIPQQIPLPSGPLASGSIPLLFEKSGILVIASLAKERPYTLLLVPGPLQTSKAGITASWMAFARFKDWSAISPAQ
jgi:hypothetical protein